MSARRLVVSVISAGLAAAACTAFSGDEPSSPAPVLPPPDAAVIPSDGGSASADAAVAPLPPLPGGSLVTLRGASSTVEEQAGGSDYAAKIVAPPQAQKGDVLVLLALEGSSTPLRAPDFGGTLQAVGACSNVNFYRMSWGARLHDGRDRYDLSSVGSPQFEAVTLLAFANAALPTKALLQNHEASPAGAGAVEVGLDGSTLLAAFGSVTALQGSPPPTAPVVLASRVPVGAGGLEAFVAPVPKGASPVIGPFASTTSPCWATATIVIAPAP